MKYLSVPRADADRALDEQAARRVGRAMWAVYAAFLLLPTAFLLAVAARVVG